MILSYKLNIMDAKITMSFDATIIEKAKKICEKPGHKPQQAYRDIIT